MATSLDTFHEACAERGLSRQSYTTVPGFFEKTLVLDDAPPMNIALAFIDCDMYSSTKAVLRFLKPRLKHGMIIAFDDFFCWSSQTVSGEKAAFEEFSRDLTLWKLVGYRDFGFAGASFVVESMV